MKNMKNICSTISIWIAVLLLASACDSLLDVTPQDKITDLSYWKKTDDFKLVANRFYTFLKGADLYDRNSDVAYNNRDRDSESNGTYVASESDGVWNDSYANLRIVNYLLMQAEGYANKDQIKQYVAEAHFFRAYLYHILLYRFGGVPIITQPLDINSGELQAPRDSREAVVSFILDELDLAIAGGLPLENSISTSEKGRISQQAAQALKARVALYEATWQKYRNNTGTVNALLDKAIAEAKNVMNSNTYSLFTALGDSSYKYLFIIENQFSNPGGFTKKDNPEFILVRKYEYGISQYNVSHGLMQTFTPTRTMADMYLTQNGLPIDHPSNNQFQGKQTSRSEYINRDLRMWNTFRVPGIKYYNYGSMARDYNDPDAPGMGIQVATPGEGYACHKFMTERNADAQGSDWPIIRYPEVLLIYAEALYERNGLISNEDLNRSVNVLRERGKVAPLTNEFTTANGLNMLTEIRRERTVELFMEDFRLNDLKRWHMAVDELKKPLTGIKYIGTEAEQNYPNNPSNPFVTDPDGYILFEASSSRYFSEKNYLRPIPLQQRFLNPNLEQNPGWE
jgi:hypothetical protein